MRQEIEGMRLLTLECVHMKVCIYICACDMTAD